MKLYTETPWKVEFFEDFESEFKKFNTDVQDELLAKTLMLAVYGPVLGRPHVDTLKGSKYANMKELRFDVGNEVWRVAFAFDLERKAILLTGANKKGKDQKQFYKTLIKIADERYTKHLKKINKIPKDGDSDSKSIGRASKKAPGKNKG